jgi:hypothetical protein
LLVIEESALPGVGEGPQTEVTFEEPEEEVVLASGGGVDGQIEVHLPWLFPMVYEFGPVELLGLGLLHETSAKASWVPRGPIDPREMKSAVI